MNDAVILLCGVILLLAILPMVLMGRAFKAGASRKGAQVADCNLVVGEPGAGKGTAGHSRDDSTNFSDSGGGDGGGGGK